METRIHLMARTASWPTPTPPAKGSRVTPTLTMMSFGPSAKEPVGANTIL